MTGDQLLLIAIVEFVETGISLKLKINKQYALSSSCYPPTLRQSLLTNIYLHSIKDNDNNEKESEDKLLQLAENYAKNDKSSFVEVFDVESNKFVQINEKNSDSSNFSINHFGKRIRCRITKCKIAKYSKEEEKNNIPRIKGRFFPFSSSGIQFGGKTLRISEKLNSGEVRTGLNVWDGSLLLARYLEIYPGKIESKRVIELGAGCGLVGIAAAILSAKQVTLTDLAYAIPLMQENLIKNRENIPAITKVECEVCDWFTATWSNTFAGQEKYDVILVADCVWVKELVDPLLRIMKELIISCGEKTKIIISYQRRGKDAHDLFYSSLLQHFEVDEIDLDTAFEEYELPNIFYLFECTYKK